MAKGKTPDKHAADPAAAPEAKSLQAEKLVEIYQGIGKNRKALFRAKVSDLDVGSTEQDGQASTVSITAATEAPTVNVLPTTDTADFLNGGTDHLSLRYGGQLKVYAKVAKLHAKFANSALSANLEIAQHIRPNARRASQVSTTGTTGAAVVTPTVTPADAPVLPEDMVATPDDQTLSGHIHPALVVDEVSGLRASLSWTSYQADDKVTYVLEIQKDGTQPVVAYSGALHTVNVTLPEAGSWSLWVTANFGDGESLKSQPVALQAA